MKDEVPGPRSFLESNIIAKRGKFYEEKRQLHRERITWALSKVPIKKSDN